MENKVTDCEWLEEIRRMLSDDRYSISRDPLYQFLINQIDKRDEALKELLRTGAYDPSMPQWSEGRDQAREVLKGSTTSY